MQPDIRWKQRFQNFKRAFFLLRQALDEKREFSDLEQEGIIQRFEYTFELSWKTFKDYLEHSGIVLDEVSPRRVIKECTNKGILAAAEMSPEVYLNMMLERNALSHTYDFERFKQALINVQGKYLPELERQYEFLSRKEIEGDE